MKESCFWDIFSFPAKVSPPVLLVFINFVLVFLLCLLIEAPVGCLLRLLCPIVQFAGCSQNPSELGRHLGSLMVQRPLSRRCQPPVRKRGRESQEPFVS